jgi:hypothetical protein
MFSERDDSGAFAVFFILGIKLLNNFLKNTECFNTRYDVEDFSVSYSRFIRDNNRDIV